MTSRDVRFGPLPTTDIVRRAQALCHEIGFKESCVPEVGQLLYRWTSAYMGGQLLELGTGCGVGTAWMASGLQVDEGAQLFTIDSDANLTTAVSPLFADWPSVTVLNGDWREALALAPFHMIFVDVADAKKSGINALLDALAEGGLILIDDLTPIELWPPDWRGKRDPIRETWLNHPRLDSDELRISHDHAVILGMKSESQRIDADY